MSEKSKADIILEKAYSLKGSHSYDEYCQRFVRICCEAAGIKGNAASANEAYSLWCISSDMKNIPKGAAVYFKGVGSYGHVGLSTGSGNIIHAANGVRIESVEKCDKKYVFRGWGWQGGVALSGTGTTKATATKGTAKSTGTKTSTKTSTAKKTKTIEQVVKQSLGGDFNFTATAAIDGIGEVTDSKYELLIENESVYLPVLCGEITLEYSRSLAPSKLCFGVIKDALIDFREGSPVRLRIDGKDVFRGYVFEKTRAERDIIYVTAYDNLRYLKNKDTVLYRNKKYSDLLKMLIEDYRLEAGDICDTGFVIEKKLDEGTLFDILANAADLTYLATGKKYVLLDDFGKICLRSEDAMATDLVFTADNIASFDYTSTIDKEVYNYVSLAVDSKQDGERKVYTKSDSNTALWGRLQYYKRITEELTEAQIKDKINDVLKRYSRKRRYLTLKNARGDIAVRGGSRVRVKLDLGDIVIDEMFECERVKHTFCGMHHLMDMALYGREGEVDV
jgi:hypothetical protein